MSEMNFVKPGPNKRVCGYLIDALALNILQLIVYMVSQYYLPWIIFVIYWLLRDSVNRQSIGKMAVGLQVHRDDGEVITPAEGAVRNISIAIPFVIIVEYFVMLRDQEGKRLGDKWAKTKVNDLIPEKSDKTYLWISIAVLLLIIFLSRPLMVNV